jgi:hypothetical protein
VYWLGELIPILGIVFVIGVPVTALAAHFVLRPLVRDITTAILGGRGRGGEQNSEVERRLVGLEEGQQHIQLRLSQLVEAERFRQRLESGTPKEGG